MQQQRRPASHQPCTTSEAAMRLPERSPDENDLATLQAFTKRCIRFVTYVYTHVGLHEYVELRNSICSRLTLFNARRGEEPSRLKIEQWTDRGKWLNRKAVTSLGECGVRGEGAGESGARGARGEGGEAEEGE